MQFRFIQTVLENIIIDLEVLVKDANNYNMLLFQNKGVFNVGVDSFGNETDCSVKFSSFLALAKERNVALAMTPEYSCPWNTIRETIRDEENWPNNSKLWALGCESITPAEIITFKEAHESEDIIIHYDDNAFNNGGGVLLDPFVYIFKAEQYETQKLIVLVQFKTQHMGVWEAPIERNKYIWGNEIYVLRNAEDSINLFTNICSEAARFSITHDFKKQLNHRWDENPYIILNPQMNPSPSHEYFKGFRRSILEYQNKDIISLNWAGGTVLSGKEEPLIPLSKSSIVFKTPEVNYEDSAGFLHNHKKGLYYVNRKAHNHAYYMNPTVELFLITNQKPASSGIPGALSRRTGPLVSNVFDWNIENEEFVELNQVSDGFLEFLDGINCNSQALLSPEIGFIDKERLVGLSFGKAEAKGDDIRWYKIDKLKSFMQDENETVNRLTYVYDESGKDKRIAYVECIDCINNNILPNPNLFPENLSSFRENCTEVMFFYNNGCYNYKFNLATNDGKYKTTVAYLGRTDKGTAKKTLKQLQDLYDKEDQSRKLVVVWYKDNPTDLKYISHQAPPMINDDSTVDSNSIMNL